MNIYYDGDFASGVDAIQSGSYISEANPALSENLPDGSFMMDLSQFHFHMTGAYYEKAATTGGLNYIFVEFRNADDYIVAGIGLPFSKVTASPGYTSTYLCDTTVSKADMDIYIQDDPVPASIVITLGYTYKSGGYIIGSDVEVPAISVTGYPYVPPALSAFTMSRALSDGTISNQGEYGRYDITSNLAAISASDEPSFIKSATALTVSFTRGSTDYSHAAASGGTGLLQSGGSALQLGNEETFTVTATLTDGINTVTMSALLSANFAIFNANAAKNSIGIGKYCDGTFTGLDVNMPTMFRKEVTLGVSPFEILWVNPNPTSSMAAVNVTMSRAVEEGEFIFSAYRYSNSDDDPRLLAFAFVGVMQMRMIITNSTNNRNGNREVEFTANSATAKIGAGFANNATSNSTMIPLFFATLRDFKITSAMLSAWVAPT